MRQSCFCAGSDHATVTLRASLEGTRRMSRPAAAPACGSPGKASGTGSAAGAGAHAAKLSVAHAAISAAGAAPTMHSVARAGA